MDMGAILQIQQTLFKMKNKFGKFLATPIGSIVKHFFFILAVLWYEQYESGVDLWSMDWLMWKKLIAVAVGSCLPMIINYINKDYKNYGLGKTE